MPKSTTFFIQDPDGLNVRFYEGYDAKFLLSKAHALLTVAGNEEPFKRILEENEDSANIVDDKFLEALRAEVYFAEFHQFEAFFALLVAVYQELPHWLYLTTYTTAEIKKKAEAFLVGDFRSLTNEQEDSLYPFLNWAVYAGFMTTDAEKQAKWQTNLDNIEWFMRRIAKRYLEGPEYNAYKHGVRVMAGPSYLTFRLSDNPASGFTWASDDSVTFLELKDNQEGGRTVYVTTKQFNPIESLAHLVFMSRILETVSMVRLARLTEEADAPGELCVPLNLFTIVDKDALYRLSSRNRWSFPV